MDFPNESFDLNYTRRCSCADAFCTHRYQGQLDDFQLMQFLDMTRSQSSEVLLVNRLFLLLLFTFTIVFLDFLANMIFKNK